MEYGNFSMGRFQVKGEASIVFLGNLDVLGSLPHEKYDHLFEPLPEELVDTALFERIHGFIPGWEMPKLTDRSFADGFGFMLGNSGAPIHLGLNEDESSTPLTTRIHLSALDPSRQCRSTDPDMSNRLIDRQLVRAWIPFIVVSRSSHGV